MFLIGSPFVEPKDGMDENDGRRGGTEENWCSASALVVLPRRGDVVEHSLGRARTAKEVERDGWIEPTCARRDGRGQWGIRWRRL